MILQLVQSAKVLHSQLFLDKISFSEDQVFFEIVNHVYCISLFLHFCNLCKGKTRSFANSQVPANAWGPNWLSKRSKKSKKEKYSTAGRYFGKHLIFSQLIFWSKIAEY